MITYSELMKNKYGCKVYKLSLDTMCTCPNRDGTKGYGGCIFCSEGGSGDFAEKIKDSSYVKNALEKAKERVASKIKGDAKYVAYFQSFTNTYGDPDRLFSIYEKAALQDDIVELSIGTRPDCVGEEVIKRLSKLNKIKPVTIELGLQTIHDKTAEFINRGYLLEEFSDAYKRLKDADLSVVIHLIIGLPYESKDDMKASVLYINSLNPKPDGIKLQLMHVMKNTKLADVFERNPEIFYDFSLEDYADFIKELVDMISDDIVIHRLTGDAPKKLLIHPLWSADKKKVLNTLNKKLNK